MKKIIATLLVFLWVALQIPAIATVIVNDANPKDCGIRASLVSGVAVGDSTSAGTIYGIPVDGGRISLYDGQAHWKSYTVSSQIGYALSGTTLGNMYDLYAYYNAGTGLVQFDTPVQWSSPTTIPTRTVINGVSLNPANTTRRLICSFYGTGTNLTADWSGARCLSNQQNRVERPLAANNTGTYSYAGGFRYADGTAATATYNGVTNVFVASSDGTNVAKMFSNIEVNVPSGSQFQSGLNLSTASAPQTVATLSGLPNSVAGEAAGYFGTCPAGISCIVELEAGNIGSACTVTGLQMVGSVNN